MTVKEFRTMSLADDDLVDDEDELEEEAPSKEIQEEETFGYPAERNPEIE
jgi:hypothetical protein